MWSSFESFVKYDVGLDSDAVLSGAVKTYNAVELGNRDTAVESTLSCKNTCEREPN